MERSSRLAAAVVVAAGLVGTGSIAWADCASELDALANQPKGGATAPLATGGATPQTGGMAPAEGATSAEGAETGGAKDGTMTPMGASPDIATSSQDAQAQSEGGETAASQAAGSAGHDSRQAALESARQALADGDEKACMDAVTKAKEM